jgi:uncharacterized protein YdeI (BOF family)
MSAKRSITIAAALAIAILIGTACRKSGSVLGNAPGGEPRSVVATREGLTPPNVTLHGKMVEKCPTAGCWFYLSDPTGAIKVDTKTAGFVVTKVPLQAEVTVSGKLVQEGSDTVLEATGLRY